jgi:hypothetical protein
VTVVGLTDTETGCRVMVALAVWPDTVAVTVTVCAAAI